MQITTVADSVRTPSRHAFDRFISPGIEELRRRRTRVALAVQPARGGSLPNRSRLLFKHFPKGGGSFAKGALAGCMHEPPRILQEHEPLKPDHQRKAFVIASIREPCAGYLSLWAYGKYAHNESLFFRGCATRSHQESADPSVPLFPANPPCNRMREQRGAATACSLYGECTGHTAKDATDRAAFHRWLADDDVSGIMAARFVSMFSRRPRVDCWVSPEPDLPAALGLCLAKFERQGGNVLWGPSASSSSSSSSGGCRLPRPPYASRRHRDAAHKGGRRLAQAGRRNASPHLPCAAYFSGGLGRKARGLLLAGFDRALTDASFGFGGCCGGKCQLCGM